MKTFFKSLLAAALFAGSVATAMVCDPGFDGRGEDGWPLPWPFPYAKECPMDWNGLSGTYTLSDSASSGELIVKVTVLMKKGIRLVRVSRYNHVGRMLLDGTTTVTEKQKVLSLYLTSTFENSDTPRIWAVIKMHYDSSVFSCTASHLVPILTVQGLSDKAPPTGIDYKMTKLQ